MNIYDFTVTDPAGRSLDLSEYSGRVLLIVNTASKCGFTPQFAGLEELWQSYRDAGLTVIGFPCNQFGGQDPGSNDEIVQFCQVNYGVSFPMMGKIDVNGDGADPLFTWLVNQAPGFLGTKRIKWNFTKFLVGRDGRVLARFSPNESPESLSTAIESALSAQPATA